MSYENCGREVILCVCVETMLVGSEPNACWHQLGWITEESRERSRKPWYSLSVNYVHHFLYAPHLPKNWTGRNGLCIFIKESHRFILS